MTPLIAKIANIKGYVRRITPRMLAMLAILAMS